MSTHPKQYSLIIQDDLHKLLRRISKQNKMPEAEILKSALLLFSQHQEKARDPYTLGKDLFDQVTDGPENLSQDYKKILKEKLNAKHNH